MVIWSVDRESGDMVSRPERVVVWSVDRRVVIWSVDRRERERERGDMVSRPERERESGDMVSRPEREW